MKVKLFSLSLHCVALDDKLYLQITNKHTILHSCDSSYLCVWPNPRASTGLYLAFSASGADSSGASRMYGCVKLATNMHAYEYQAIYQVAASMQNVGHHMCCQK